MSLRETSVFLSSPNNNASATCLSRLPVLITAETQKLDALKTHTRGLS